MIKSSFGHPHQQVYGHMEAISWNLVFMRERKRERNKLKFNKLMKQTIILFSYIIYTQKNSGFYIISMFLYN